MTARLLILGLAALLTACRAKEPPARPVEERAAEARPAAASPDTIHIDPGMLRDLRMTTARVEERSGAADVDMLGEIAVNRDQYAEVAPPIDAQVTRLLVATNATVSTGTPLVELRSPELGRARADLMIAEARVQLATRTVDRKRALAAERIVPARELQEAEGQMQEATAAQSAALASLRALGAEASDAATDDPARFVVRSPIAGTVLERAATIGQLAQSASPMFTIADLSTLWLVVHAFERDAVLLTPGQPVRITLAAMPGRELQGRIASVGRQVDPSSRTVDVRVELPNRDGVLRPGMSATAHVPVKGESRTLLSVAAAAMQRVGENWMVFIPKSEGVFEMRRVGRGRDLDGEIEVVSGVRAGDTVVVDGAFLLKAEAEKASGGDHDHGD